MGLATEQKLKDFYYNEPIDIAYLRSIYKGNIQIQVRSSNSALKLYWKEARLLALTEFKFQKEEIF